MKLMMIKLSVTIYSIIPFMKTPMSMGILLLTQTMISTLILSKVLKSSWMSMVIFLMFVGGLLILFMYMSSIASNEKFSPNLSMYFFMMIMIMLPMEELLTENINMDNLLLYSNNESISLMKIYNKKTFMITMVMFMYMFLTMIVVTKIIKIHKGPLRSMMKK
uniref:NADH-ubiquinone oxidoreductase chain 6 n=1 Tax=Psammotettix sp. EMHAU-2015-Zz053036 TaxID=2038643 RepID=A0A343K610_9HEMI|nr:NADH dehydrogenase subunit 6 [Psammotettix sp. EMHAU-2015-Zz053036]